jgi:DNA adenine methylase
LRVPHPIPYQGSKRRLAGVIVGFFHPEISRLIEPFAGSAAVTLASASRSLAQEYVIGEVLKPLAGLWDLIISDPKYVADQYEHLWRKQPANSTDYFFQIRAEYNQTNDPILLLYLVVRCVKNAIRFNPKGEFNQSPDHRRKGMRPEKMRSELYESYRLLHGKAQVLHSDYVHLLDLATKDDLIYMDPPYFGVSTGRDCRYFKQLDHESFLQQLDKLNHRKISYILSYDGSCGDKTYCPEFPKELKLRRIMVNAGRSSQATLLGRADITIESLYLSPGLMKRIGHVPKEIELAKQRSLVL